MISTIIYSAAAFAIGIFSGLVIELMVDNSYFTELEAQNKKLKFELEAAKKEPEVIEIIDNRTPDTDFSFPNKEGF